MSLLAEGVQLEDAASQVLPIEDVLAYKNEEVVARLVRDYGLTQDEAELLFEDTLRYLYLCATTDVGALAPSLQIDCGWHTFILYTRAYGAFCRKFLGKFVHHQPKSLLKEGTDSEVLSARNTAALAQATFGDISENWTKNLPQAADCEQDCSPDSDCHGDGSCGGDV